MVASVLIPPLDAPPWRAAAVATIPDRDKPELVKAALENSYLFNLPKRVAEEPRRAASIALGIKDTARRHNALAILIPAYIRVDRTKAESWRDELSAALGSAPETSEQLAFIVAFVRADLALSKYRRSRGGLLHGDGTPGRPRSPPTNPFVHCATLPWPMANFDSPERRISAQPVRRRCQPPEINPRGGGSRSAPQCSKLRGA
jgi:hypothetical protein